MDSFMDLFSLHTSFLEPAVDVNSPPLEGFLLEEDLVFSDDEHLPPRPPRLLSSPSSACSPQPLSRVTRQSKRIRPQKKDQDFEICLDETAEIHPLPRRVYYGSTVEALGDISNGQTFQYTADQMFRKYYNEYLDKYLAEGRMTAYNYVIENMERDFPQLNERVQGFYYWHNDYHHKDAWMWIEANNYHLDWLPHQIFGCKAAIKWMGFSAIKARDLRREGDAEEAANIEAMMVEKINVVLSGLGITNIVFSVPKPRYYQLTPTGGSRKLNYREDYTLEEQEVIDRYWPHHWAEGEEKKETQETQEIEEEKSAEVEEEEMKTTSQVDVEEFTSLSININFES